jgi:anti-sigma factor RsiW
MKIMNEHFCTYPGKRDEVLVAYLYDELGADERAAFDRHVAACAPCRAELTALGGVRSELARWTPPESAVHLPFTVAPAHPQKSIGGMIREIPAWAQVMAATLILGAAAGLANLDVHYNADGLSVRTGWRQSASDQTARSSAAPASTPSLSTSTAPWRNDLAALEQQLRTELQVHPAAATAPSTATNDDVVLRRVRQLIQDSERRQQSELALRVAEVARDMQSQRQADLVKIDRTLGLIQNNSRIEVMRTQRQVNSLAQQVSQRP